MIVYKYLNSERIDILERAAIRFTQPAALNDPFESLPCLTEYREQVRDTLLRKRVRRFGKALSDITEPAFDHLLDKALDRFPELISHHFGILSLSRLRDNLLMWGHYTDSHRGFVVGFDSASDFFKPGNGKAIEGLKAVRYSEERAIVPIDGLADLQKEAMGAANEGMFFTKSPDWAYEQEFRILADPNVADIKLGGAGITQICLFRFPRDSVKEVIVGCRMADPVRERINKIIEADYPGAKLLRAKLNERRFVVDICET